MTVALQHVLQLLRKHMLRYGRSHDGRNAERPFDAVHILNFLQHFPLVFHGGVLVHHDDVEAVQVEFFLQFFIGLVAQDCVRQ